MIPVAIAAFLLLLAVAFLIARPFVAPVAYEAAPTLEQLRADRDRLRAQLRELDMDFETGKLGAEEHGRYRARRLQQIEATTRAIREAQADAEPQAAAAVDGRSDEEIERRIAARRRVLTEPEAPTCRRCGAPIDHQDRRCRGCGVDLMTAETR